MSCLHGYMMALARVRTRLLEYNGLSEPGELVRAIVQAAHGLALPGTDKALLQMRMVSAARFRSQKVCMCLVAFGACLIKLALMAMRKQWFHNITLFQSFWSLLT